MRSRIAACLVAALYRAANSVLRICSWVLWPWPRPREALRICVFRNGNVGDIACSLPALHAVRQAYPEARLTLLTSPGARGMPSASEVLAGASWIDEIHLYYADEIDTWPKRRALLKVLRSRRFDLWIDLPQDLSTIARQFRDMAFARLTGARWARGWRVDTLRLAPQAQTAHLEFKNEVERTLEIVRTAGIPIDEIDFGLPSERAVVRRVDDMLRAHALDRCCLVAIAPGAKRSTNRWEARRFAAVARQLAGRGAGIAILGDEWEAPMCAEIAAQIGARAHSFAGRFSVAESIEVLRRCTLSICLDSGVQHLSSAVGTPCISLFSRWQMPGKWHPHGGRNVVIRKDVPCHTCLRDLCPRENLCMKSITEGEVFAAAIGLMRSPPEMEKAPAAASSPSMAKQSSLARQAHGARARTPC